MLAKVHSSILHIHGLVGEKEASKWLHDSQKATVSTTATSKTPAKKQPSTRRKATAATSSAAAGAAGTEDEGPPAGGQGSSTDAEKEIICDALKLQYVHLLEMDELIREKLFILQVRITVFSKIF